jgi:hypothetical protein
VQNLHRKELRHIFVTDKEITLTLKTYKMDIIKLEGFQKLLNQSPPAEAIKKRYDGVKYLPISYYEAELDKLFFGLWSTHIVEAKQVLNEIVCTVQLTYTHPITGEKYSKCGVGSVQIQQKSKTKITELPIYKIPNALETCLPKAKTEAIKNAAKQLGKRFGRDLSRKDDQISQYTPLLGSQVTLERKGKLTLISNQIQDITSLSDLNSFMLENEDFLSDKEVLKLYEDQANKLKSLPPKS